MVMTNQRQSPLRITKYNHQYSYNVWNDALCIRRVTWKVHKKRLNRITGFQKHIIDIIFVKLNI